jgi:hypothetical protein
MLLKLRIWLIGHWLQDVFHKHSGESKCRTAAGGESCLRPVGQAPASVPGERSAMKKELEDTLGGISESVATIRQEMNLSLR